MNVKQCRTSNKNLIYKKKNPGLFTNFHLVENLSSFYAKLWLCIYAVQHGEKLL